MPLSETGSSVVVLYPAFRLFQWFVEFLSRLLCAPFLAPRIMTLRKLAPRFRPAKLHPLDVAVCGMLAARFFAMTPRMYEPPIRYIVRSPVDEGEDMVILEAAGV